MAHTFQFLLDTFGKARHMPLPHQLGMCLVLSNPQSISFNPQNAPNQEETKTFTITVEREAVSFQSSEHAKKLSNSV